MYFDIFFKLSYFRVTRNLCRRVSFLYSYSHKCWRTSNTRMSISHMFLQFNLNCSPKVGRWLNHEGALLTGGFIHWWVRMLLEVGARSEEKAHCGHDLEVCVSLPRFFLLSLPSGAMTWAAFLCPDLSTMTFLHCNQWLWTRIFQNHAFKHFL